MWRIYWNEQKSAVYIYAKNVVMKFGDIGFTETLIKSTKINVL